MCLSQHGNSVSTKPALKKVKRHPIKCRKIFTKICIRVRLFHFFLWKLLWLVLVSGQSIFREESLRSIPVQESLGPDSEVAQCLQQQGLIFHFRGKLWAIAISCTFSESLGQHWPTTQKRFSHVQDWGFR